MDQSARSAPVKLCTGSCGQVKPLTEFSPAAENRDGRKNKCRACRREDDRAWRIANPEADKRKKQEKRERAAAWRIANPEAAELARKKMREWAEANPGVSSARNKQHRARLKATVLAHYGEACACCGSTDRLGIDHIDGNGAEHRRKLFEGRGGARFYAWLIAQGLPEGYQTMCQPCNASKHKGPRCRLNHDSPGREISGVRGRLASRPGG